MIKKLFREALNTMLETGEFERLEKYAKTKEAKKAIQRYKEVLAEDGADNLPIIPLIETLADVISVAQIMTRSLSLPVSIPILLASASETVSKLILHLSKNSGTRPINMGIAAKPRSEFFIEEREPISQ